MLQQQAHSDRRSTRGCRCRMHGMYQTYIDSSVALCVCGLLCEAYVSYFNTSMIPGISEESRGSCFVVADWPSNGGEFEAIQDRSRTDSGWESGLGVCILVCCYVLSVGYGTSNKFQVVDDSMIAMWTI